MTTELIIGIVFGLFQMLLATLGTLIWARDRERKQELEKLSTKHDKLVEDLPRTFVMKDDFLRTMSSVDKKLDRLIQEVGAFGGDLRQHIGRDEAR